MLPAFRTILPRVALPTMAVTLRHATLWDDAGTLLVPFPDTVFRIARPTLLDAAPHLRSHLRSPEALPASGALGLSPSDLDELAVLAVPASVAASDFAVLLDYLAGRAPLDAAYRAPLLRISAPRNLDVPAVYAAACAHLRESFPSALTAPSLSPAGSEEELELTLELAMHYDVDPETKKTLLYRVATSTDFDPTGAHDPSAPLAAADPIEPAVSAAHPALSTRTLRICHRVLAGLIADFTPVLFTVGSARHMACTDVLAARWMDDVIAPALADGGVGQPLEALRRIQAAAEGWRAHGLCDECVHWLNGEWEGEREAIWAKLDAHIVEAEKAEGLGDAGSSLEI